MKGVTKYSRFFISRHVVRIINIILCYNFIFYFRENPGRHLSSTGSSRSSSRNYNSPLSVSPHLSPRGNPSQYSPAGLALTPAYGAPFEVMHEGFFSEIPDFRAPRKQTGNLDEHVVNQVSGTHLT